MATMAIRGKVMAMAVEQLQVLLTEAMATLSGRRETGDDQDHA